MRLTIKAIESLNACDKDQYFWDDDLPNYGLRIKPSGVKSFIVQYRNASGNSRRLTIGRFGVLTPDEARRLAREKLADVIKGFDPVAAQMEQLKAMTVNRIEADMAKKSRTKKHKQQSGLNYTPLDGLRNQGKTLKSPLSTLPGGTTFRSWVDECIPNVVWACILISHLERKACLALFRSVVINMREKLPEAEYKNTFITHNFLSLLTEKQFDIIFENVLLDDQAKDLLSALLLIDCLPDKAQWQRYLTAPDPERHGQVLASAIMACFDHQSQESTDIRWMKVMNLICTGRMIFPESMKERLEEFHVYPDKGDMRSVRPSIRAMEMSTRTLEFGEEAPNVKLPPQHKDQFWTEMFQKSTCNIMEEFEPPALPADTIKQEIYDLYHEVSNHFDKTITHTGIDAKHDAAFGLVLYAMTLAFDNALGYSHTLVEGRIILRSIMEAFVTLHFLKHKDNDTIWRKYRSDGSGKTKLAFLKNIKADEVPEFIDIERLERLANEDMWLEFQDINIGSWAKSDLRTMATEAGVKDIYDKYYDWASGYTPTSYQSRTLSYCRCRDVNNFCATVHTVLNISSHTRSGIMWRLIRLLSSYRLETFFGFPRLPRINPFSEAVIYSSQSCFCYQSKEDIAWY